ALRQAQVRATPFPCARGLLRDAAADRLDIEDRHVLRMSKRHCYQQQRWRSTYHPGAAHRGSPSKKAFALSMTKAAVATSAALASASAVIALRGSLSFAQPSFSPHRG